MNERNRARCLLAADDHSTIDLAVDKPSEAAGFLQLSRAPRCQGRLPPVRRAVQWLADNSLIDDEAALRSLVTPSDLHRRAPPDPVTDCRTQCRSLPDRPLWLSRLAYMGCYAGIMTVTIHLDGAVAEELAAEAARRGQTADQLAARSASGQPPQGAAPRSAGLPLLWALRLPGAARREADEMLAEGFGRD